MGIIFDVLLKNFLIMRKVGGILLIAVIGGLISVGLYKFIEDNSAVPEVNAQSLDVYTASYRQPVSGSVSQVSFSAPDFTTAAESTINAVVHIKTEYQRKSNVYDYFFDFHDFFGHPRNDNQRSMPYQGSGSGVIISQDGYIVTNNHVVQEADLIEVVLNDKRTYDARVIGTDPSTDLALIKIDEIGLSFLSYGNSDHVKIGEWVLAVGNPFNLTSTVTAGIVSAKARNINILGDIGGVSSIESFIQTDAAVNRGNSGGALVNTKGELIGINAAIASNTGSYSGYSFAIPVNIVKKVVEDLLNYGMVQRAYIGVSILELGSVYARENGITETKGVYVAGTTDNGAAREVGIEEGDIITHIAGTEINHTSELLEIVSQYRPGDNISLVYNRDGETIKTSLVLKNKEGNTEIIKPEEKSVLTAMGATFESLTQSEKDRLRIQNGVRVKDLQYGKLRKAGIREGFIITRIDEKRIDKVDDLEDILENKTGGVLIEGVYPNGMRAYYGFGL
jgi:serine protease Do